MNSYVKKYIPLAGTSVKKKSRGLQSKHDGVKS